MELLIGICLILWLACGVINYFVVKSKGYPNRVCLTYGVCGFLFGFVALIFALCKKPFTNDPMLIVEELGKLAELKENGAISEADFEVQKSKLLDCI